jgi:hypothetical protein
MRDHRVDISIGKAFKTSLIALNSGLQWFIFGNS